MSEKTRTHKFEIEIDSPPELVWKAISEADGITRWFAPEAKVTPGVGGSIMLSWGPGMEGTERIKIWEPGKRLGHGPADSPKLVEYTIEAKPGGGTLLRLVHSGFGAEASFDDEYESTRGGWLSFLAILKFGLERHPEKPHKNVTVFRFLGVPQADAWKKLVDAIELSPSLSELRDGMRYAAAAPSGGRFSGTVVTRPDLPGYLCLSVEQQHDSLVGLFVEKGGCLTIMSILFGDATRMADSVRAEWSRLVDRLFGPVPLEQRSQA